MLYYGSQIYVTKDRVEDINRQLHEVARGIGGESLADDLVQDAWLLALEQGLPHPTVDSEFIRHMKARVKKMRHAASIPDDGFAEPIYVSVDPSEESEILARILGTSFEDFPVDVAYDIRETLTSLPDVYQQVLFASVIAGVSIVELASEFRMTVQEAMELKADALQALRDAWNG